MEKREGFVKIEEEVLRKDREILERVVTRGFKTFVKRFSRKLMKKRYGGTSPI